MAARPAYVAGVLALLVAGIVAAGSAAAGGWGMMGGSRTGLMGGGTGSGMMRSYGYGRSGQPGEDGSGRAMFASECASCHTILQGARSGDGPNLHDVFGRKAGSLPGYDYSRAMRRSGIVWNMANLNGFIADPSAFIPGNHMPFKGLRDRRQRQELLSYLRSATR